ncbi:Putative pimeloyl-CoA dehydrogenase [gamma proteobacterium HdN1]|nr:Putative pimeloyl-CoA dehydrogenase [gamma proteobacterium HdN1]
MNFDLSQEQKMLVDSIQKFLKNDYSFETRCKLANSSLGFSEENWKLFAELGWLGVALGSDYGGFGGSTEDIMLMHEALGRALVTEPILPTALLCGRLIELLGTEAQKKSLLPSLIQGELQLALAYNEAIARNNPAVVGCVAQREGDNYVISGKKIGVLNGHAASQLLVTARTAGDVRASAGISVFLVDAYAAGVERKPYQTVDGLRAAEIEFNGVEVTAAQRLGAEGDAFVALETVLDEACLALCAEAVGAMEVLYKTTIEYCKTRKQFGVPIGKFQALQFRMVDMFMLHEQAKSMIYQAALRAKDISTKEGRAKAREAISACKVYIGKAGRRIGQEAIQLHGGMGMTDELNVGHYFKRLTAIDALFGNVDYHLHRYDECVTASREIA